MLDQKSLAKFAQISKNCNQLLNPKSKHCVNFQVLYEAQDIKLTLAEVKETLISRSRALQIPAKRMIISSIFYSQRIIPNNTVKRVKSTESVPDMEFIANKSDQELSNLTITQVQWFDINSLGFILNASSFKT